MNEAEFSLYDASLNLQHFSLYCSKEMVTMFVFLVFLMRTSLTAEHVGTFRFILLQYKNFFGLFCYFISFYNTNASEYV
jgi:hypothetical protein